MIRTQIQLENAYDCFEDVQLDDFHDQLAEELRGLAVFMVRECQRAGLGEGPAMNLVHAINSWDQGSAVRRDREWLSNETK